MAILKIKRGSGVPSGLTFGELAFDTTNRILRFGVTAGFLNLTSADGGVATFNGLTGAVSGVTTSVANVFTPIQTFNSGITSAGATFTAATHCLRGLTVGLIGSGGDLNVIGRTTLQNLIVDGSGGATFNYNIIQVGPTRGISTQGFARIGTNLSVGLGATFSGWIAGSTLSSFADGTTLTISSPSSFTRTGNIRVNPQGTFVVAPEAGLGGVPSLGSTPKLTISNFQTAGTGVVVNGSDFVIESKNDGEFELASSLVFKGVITNSNTYIYPLNVSTGLEYSIGVPARTGTFALLQGPQTFSGTQNFSNGLSAAGGTLSGNISLLPSSGIVGVSGGISAGSFILDSSGIKTLTGTTYTFLAADNGDVLTHNNASGCTLTIPTGLPVGFSTTVIQLNASGIVKFIAGSGVTLNSYLGLTSMAGQHASASLISYASNIFNLGGALA